MTNSSLTAAENSMDTPAIDHEIATQVKSPTVDDLTTMPADPTGSSNETSLPSYRSHDPAVNAFRSDPFNFGQRYLQESDDVFEFNAWDHVRPDEEYEQYMQEQYEKQRSAPVSNFDKSRFNSSPEKWWDLFYKQKSSTFFKDRKWLTQEFPVLLEVTKPDAGRQVILEVGAGAGNTAFPILRLNQNPDLEVVAADFSKKAVETIRTSEDYEVIGRPGKIRAEVWDVAGETLPEGLREGSVDIVIMIFIFSALAPSQWRKAVDNVHRLLKPGGIVLFRDYGRGDLAQVRFKAGRYLEENFYVRGDGTRVYFFEVDELRHIWSDQAREHISVPSVQEDTGIPIGTEENTGGLCSSSKPEGIGPRVAVFDVLNINEDRRMIVNRQRRIKMFRCWIQARFQKPSLQPATQTT